MYILNQEKNCIVKEFISINIYREGVFFNLSAVYNGGEEWLGEYPSYDRALEVLQDMFRAMSRKEHTYEMP